MKRILTIALAAIVGAGTVSLSADGDHEREYEERHEYETFRAYKADREPPRGYREKEEEHEEREYRERRDERMLRERSTAPVTEKRAQRRLYEAECGACHFAYQPGLLPARSWNRMMTTLSDHFGTDASLDTAQERRIARYLVANAADRRPTDGEIGEFARRIDRESTPLRISETPYFLKEHRKISAKLIAQKEVKSLANCNACHRDAAEGRYSERNIVIPNHGPWDD
ncbi:diheme cytochrome c [Hydrogenimonas sp.]